MKCCHLKNLLPKLLCLIKSKQAKKQGFFEARINSPHCWQLVWWSDFTLWCFFFLFKKLRSHNYLTWYMLCHIWHNSWGVERFLRGKIFFPHKQARHIFFFQRKNSAKHFWGEIISCRFFCSLQSGVGRPSNENFEIYSTLHFTVV